MLLLLTECSIFITMPESNNLLQIAGKALSDESFKVPTSSLSSSFTAPVYIERLRINYGRPVCSKNLKIIGLPFKRKIETLLGCFIFIVRFLEFQVHE